MKKSLTKWLARMAKDGDVETVAEFIEAMTGETDETVETPETEETASEAEESVTVEVPENREITIDSDAFSALLERLDNLLALLTAGLKPAADDEPINGSPAEEEIAEIVEEALEAAQAGEAVGGEAPVFNAGSAGTCAEEIAEIVEAVVEPAVSTTLEPKEEDCSGQNPAVSKDALKAALMTFRPVLAKMTPRERNRVCADIAANLRSGRRSNDAGIYAALASGRKAPVNLNDLGRHIMAARNPNYKN